MWSTTWFSAGESVAVAAMEIKKRFASAVQRARRARGMSQETLALNIGADQAYVSRIESGQVNVTLETAKAIVAALDIDAAEVFRDDHPREGHHKNQQGQHDNGGC